jgi:hypothetical protein
MSIKKPFGLGLIVGILALAFAALPAIASATTMDESGGAVTSVGTVITASSSNLTFDGSTGLNLECKKNTLSGKLTANAPTPKVNITSASFLNAAGGVACLTNMAGVTAEVKADPNPPNWTLALEPENKFTLSSASGSVAFTAKIGALECTFKRTTPPGTVTGTYTTNTTPTIFTIGAGQTFTKVAGPEQCGTGGTLTGTFSIPQKITNV